MAHDAERPKEIPFQGWKSISKRVLNQIPADHVTIVSAGVAFYLFLALFPAIITLLSIYGLVAEPSQVQQQMSQLTAILPDQAHQFIADQLQRVAGKSGETLGWSVALSLLFGLWSANKGTKAIFKGVNIAYDEENSRNFFQQNGLSLLFTFAGIIVAIICMSLIIGFPALLGNLGLPAFLKILFQWGRWIILGAIIIFSLAMVYKFAPVRRNPEFRWVSTGALVSTFLWLIGSWLFSFYVNNFGSYDKTYGSVAAIVILMLWFFLTGFIILLGAEINSEMEHQTRKDSTIGKDRPMGERGAYHADQVASEHEDKA